MAVTKLSNSGIKTGVLKYDSMLAGNAAYDPAATWLIQRTTLSSNTASVTFSGIPSTYQHLQIRLLARSSTAGSNNAQLRLVMNSDTGFNYAYHNLNGNGSSVTAAGGASGSPFGWMTMGADFIPKDSLTANAFAAAIIDIHDYASTSKNKTVRMIGGDDINGAGGFINLASGLWLSTSAITSIQISCPDTFKSGSTFALYGYKG